MRRFRKYHSIDLNDHINDESLCFHGSACCFMLATQAPVVLRDANESRFNFVTTQRAFANGKRAGLRQSLRPEHGA
jgi:hypothetical protein